MSYNTGKMKNGLSASFLMSRTTGNGYVDGTKFEGGNYFIGLGYELNSPSSPNPDAVLIIGKFQ